MAPSGIRPWPANDAVPFFLCCTNSVWNSKKGSRNSILLPFFHRWLERMIRADGGPAAWPGIIRWKSDPVRSLPSGGRRCSSKSNGTWSPGSGWMDCRRANPSKFYNSLPTSPGLRGRNQGSRKIGFPSGYFVLSMRGKRLAPTSMVFPAQRSTCSRS